MYRRKKNLSSFPDVFFLPSLFFNLKCVKCPEHLLEADFLLYCVSQHLVKRFRARSVVCVENTLEYGPNQPVRDRLSEMVSREL